MGKPNSFQAGVHVAESESDGQIFTAIQNLKYLAESESDVPGFPHKYRLIHWICKKQEECLAG